MGYSDIYSDLYDAAFPQSVLDVRTELLLGGTWTDISGRVYQRAGIAITRGHPDESSAATPQTCAMTLNNRDGALSPRNPNGPYFGLLGRNTPLRMSIPQGSTCLRMEDDNTSYVSCPDSAPLRITGDIEIQIDMQLSDWTRSILMSKYSNSGGHGWDLSLNDDGTVHFFWSASGSFGVVANSTLPLPLGRIALKATLAVATGTATFYTAPTLAGPWTQLGSPVVTGATSIFASTANLAIGSNTDLIEFLSGPANFNQTPLKGASGKIFAAKLLNGIGGTVVASPVFTTQPPGTATFADAQGNLWSFTGTAQISDRKYRFHGEGTAWPPRWDETGRDVYAPVQASGLLRRFGQSGSGSGSAPLNSALYRAYVRLTGSAAPIAYWPCEDGSASTQLASAIGGAPMTVRGTPQLASDTSFLCSDALPVVNGSVWVGVIPAAPSTANVLRFLLKVPSSSPPADGTVLARLFTYGTVNRVDLIYRTGAGLELKGYNAAGANIFSTGSVSGLIALDGLYRMSVELVASGGNVQYTIATVVPAATVALTFSGTVTGSIGPAYQAWIAPNADVQPAVIGHVSVQSALDDLFDLAPALNAWQGEAAGIRFARLCGEEGVAYRVYGHPADSTAMGPQGLVKLTDLIQQCEDADKGLKFEARQVLALAYRTRASMYNQAAALALDYSQAHLSPPIEPTDDDQYTSNDVTAARTNGGSSSRQILASGSMSIQAPPNGVGRYDSSISVNLQSDTQLDDAAGWALHLGTVDEERYPSLSVQLARTELASLAAAAQDVEIGDRITVVNTPSWLPPDGISQIVRGLDESPYGFTYGITWVCAPESPYRIGVYDDATFGRYDTDGSSVYLPISSSATTMLVATANPASPLWTTSAADFPFDIEVSGERMTVTNITGSSSPQTFTVTRSVNGVVKPQSAGSDVRLFQPAVYSM